MAVSALMLLLPALVEANPPYQLKARECQHNNCVRAVIASAHPNRSGSADCASYLKTTVTPATRTVTETLSFLTTAGTTLPVTDRATIEVTNTQTNQETATVTGSAVTVTVPTGLGVSRRQVTASPSQTPSYASACSNAARYTSACSCAFGLVPTAITIEAPVTTITISVTNTVSTQTESTQTDFATVATLEIATLTQQETITLTDATVTLIPTTTSFVHLPDSTRFHIRVRGGPWNGQLISSDYQPIVDGGLDYWYPNLDSNNPQVFKRIGETGWMSPIGIDTPMNVHRFNGGSRVTYTYPGVGEEWIKCNVDSTLTLRCIAGTNLDFWSYCETGLTGLAFSRPFETPCTPLQGELEIVPV